MANSPIEARNELRHAGVKLLSPSASPAFLRKIAPAGAVVLANELERTGRANFDTSVEQTPLFSLRENAIAKEPGSGYSEGWSCVFWLGASLVAPTPASRPRLQP